MESKVLDAVWLNQGGSLTMVHLSEVSGLDRAELQVLVDSGALTPLAESGDSTAFASDAVLAARTARRLRDDFELNPDGLALAMRLLQRVALLEQELERLRAGMTGPQPHRPL
jgi:chaperone modulatory protein CbpM